MFIWWLHRQRSIKNFLSLHPIIKINSKKICTRKSSACLVLSRLSPSSTLKLLEHFDFRLQNKIKLRIDLKMLTFHDVMLLINCGPNETLSHLDTPTPVAASKRHFSVKS